MIFQVLKPIVSMLWATLLMLLMACAQAPNYAPVKTVSQTFEPDNGYVRKISPINSGTNQDKPQASANTIPKDQQNNPVRQDPVNNGTPYPKQYHNKPSQNHPTAQSVNKAAPLPLNATIINQNQEISGPTPLPYKLESHTINKLDNPALEKNPDSSQHRDVSPQNKAVFSSTNNITLQKNPRIPQKSTDSLQIAQKNNKEKTSIISIDNKKVLKLNFQWPIRGKISRNFTQTDGKGIDITGKTGQLVRAAEAGKAVYCGQGLMGFGNLVIIKHSGTYLSAYANNSRLYIKEGQHVEKGQTIGQVSAAGGLKKASLHFEIRKNGKSINPLTLLPKR
jgi:lipoprotein NlpD